MPIADEYFGISGAWITHFVTERCSSKYIFPTDCLPNANV